MVKFKPYTNFTFQYLKVLTIYTKNSSKNERQREREKKKGNYRMI